MKMMIMIIKIIIIIIINNDVDDNDKMLSNIFSRLSTNLSTVSIPSIANAVQSVLTSNFSFTGVSVSC